MVVLAELLSDRPDRMDCVSDAACSSVRSDLPWGGLKAGDAGCAGRAGAGNVAAVLLVSADGIGGASLIICISGEAGLGIKIVLRTSRRPRRVDERFGCAACCCCVRSCFLDRVDRSYCAQGINHVGHGRIGITILFLDRRIPDVKLELGSWVTLGLNTAW
jgi:hypothetical protein